MGRYSQIRSSFHTKQDRVKRVGGQFIGMNNLDRSIINRAVLKIERDQLRNENGTKEDSSSSQTPFKFTSLSMFGRELLFDSLKEWSRL